MKLESLLEAIDRQSDLHEAIKVFNGEISPRVERTLLNEADKLDEQKLSEFSRKICIYYVLAMMSDETNEKHYMNKCYETICHSILTGAVAGLNYDGTMRMTKDEVIVRLPVRVNWGVDEITAKLGGGLYLSTQVINIPRGSGIGTSSILAGAFVKAIYEIMGRQLTDDELYNRVLCMEQIMSTGGGWQDQVGDLAPGIKMVTSSPSIQQRIECTPCSINAETMRELNERFSAWRC